MGADSSLRFRMTKDNGIDPSLTLRMTERFSVVSQDGSRIIYRPDPEAAAPLGAPILLMLVIMY